MNVRTLLVSGRKESPPMPQPAANYRKRADECAALAKTARSPSERTMLLHIAETWLRLARDAEDNEQVNGRGDTRPPGTSLM